MRRAIPALPAPCAPCTHCAARPPRSQRSSAATLPAPSDSRDDPVARPATSSFRASREVPAFGHGRSDLSNRSRSRPSRRRTCRRTLAPCPPQNRCSAVSAAEIRGSTGRTGHDPFHIAQYDLRVRHRAVYRETVMSVRVWLGSRTTGLTPASRGSEGLRRPFVPASLATRSAGDGLSPAEQTRLGSADGFERAADALVGTSRGLTTTLACRRSGFERVDRPERWG